MIMKALTAIVIAAALGVGNASAQSYPTQPIRLIVLPVKQPAGAC